MDLGQESDRERRRGDESLVWTVLFGISRYPRRDMAGYGGIWRDMAGYGQIWIHQDTAKEPSRPQGLMSWEAALLAPGGTYCPHSQLLLWCYGSLGIAAHNMLWPAMGGPSRVHGVMAREATPDCSPVEFSLRARCRARGRFGIDRQIFSLLPSR